jgi:hypothetical protein
MKPGFSRTRHSKLILVGLLLATACGCSAVISRRQVGEKPAKIVAGDWEGDWVTTDGAVKVKVVDAEKGILKLVWLEDEKGSPAMKSAEVELRESGDWLFANTRDENKGQSRGYSWGRIRNEDRQIIVWLPDEKMFKQLVKDGVFPGKIAGDDVLLDELKPQHLKIITSGERGVLFSWDKPSVFVRVGK